jgi:hypothetical protein
MNNELLLKAALTFAIAISLAATGWLYGAVADFPKDYVAKDEFRCLQEDNHDAHTRIEKKIDKIHDLILQLHTYSGEGINDEDM